MLGRVHWLLWNLSPIFKGIYQYYYDYRFHKYVFVRHRYKRNIIIDLLIVVRTSKRCFRLMYYNADSLEITYHSFPTSAKCAKFMEEIFKRVR